MACRSNNLSCDCISCSLLFSSIATSQHNIETLYTFGLRCFSIARALAYKENANILCGIGMTLSDLGKAHDGFKVLDLSIKIDPANHITMLYRGIIHYDLGRLREASSELAQEGGPSACWRSSHEHPQHVGRVGGMGGWRLLALL